METDFFTFSRRTIARDNEVGHCNAAHNREMALRCFAKFSDREEMAFSELSPGLMVQFEQWLMANGRKESTSRFYLNQISSIYNLAVKDGIVPKVKLLRGVKAALPAKRERELLTEAELRRMRDADLSDSKSMALARDLFFFSIYGRGICLSDITRIRKTDVNGLSLTYTSQTVNQPRVTVRWDAAMQEIACRYPSDTAYLFPFVTSDNKLKASREVKRVRENVENAFRQIAVRCNLSVVPSMYMVKELYQRLIERVSVSTII